jgi:hypothetical protein
MDLGKIFNKTDEETLLTKSNLLISTTICWDNVLQWTSQKKPNAK